MRKKAFQGNFYALESICSKTHAFYIFTKTSIIFGRPISRKDLEYVFFMDYSIIKSLHWMRKVTFNPILGTILVNLFDLHAKTYDAHNS